MGVQLRPMRDDELAAWLPLLRQRFAHDLVRDFGLTPERAAEGAAADVERLLPGGRLPAGHAMFVVEADGESVGDLWLAEREELSHPSLVIFDVTVEEPHRGRGYGKAAMAFAEGEARRRGIDRIALYVGGRNEAARGLYRSLGYEEDAVAMSKPLP
jgi:ribosomal protein S18 acetylase RimI-like enzyme